MFSGSMGAPDSISDVLLLPLLFTFFALAARISARIYWRNFGKRKRHWWYVYPLLALAIFFGADWMYKMFNPDSLTRMMYLGTLTSRKVLAAHYLSFFIPLLTTIGIVLYDRLEAKRISRMVA